MITWIVFDLGGVLVDYDPEAVVQAYARHADGAAAAAALQTILRAALHDPDGPSALWGSGRLTAEEYFARLEALTGLRLARSVHEACDLAELLGEDPWMLRLLEGLAARFRLACLSNTHDLHWEHMLAHYRCMQLFEVQLASHLIGWRKPDPRAYAALLERLGAPPHECLFIDDREENVVAARQAGLAAVRFASQTQLLVALRAL